MREERPLRPLLPTTTRREAPPPQSRRRDRVASACEECRIRKIKCNGGRIEPGNEGVRPVCWECLKRSTLCHYAAHLTETQGQAVKRKHDALRIQNEAYAELFALIQTRPDNESLEILRRIKMGADVESILRHVRDGDLLVQLSVEPETRLRYTLPYMDSMPAFLLVPDNQYLTTSLYEATFKPPSSSPDTMTLGEPRTSKFNAVLAAACQDYKGMLDLAKFWMPDNLQPRFFLEAKCLWELEMGVSRLTSIHTAQVLHGILNGNGMSTVRDFYTSEAVAMAHNLRIFELAPVQMNPRLRRGREFTAWALWLWQVGVSYYYRRAPFIRDPPAFAAPDPDVDPEWYGEVYVRYPLSPTVTRMQLDHVMRATIDLRIIMNDISLLQFASHEQKELSPAQVLEFKVRLDRFLQKLPPTLAPSRISLPCHFNVHLFRGQVNAQKTSSASPRLFDGKAALQIQNEAYIRFETIMRIRYLRHSFDAYDAWGLLYLIYLGNLALDSLSNDGHNSASELTTKEVTCSTAVLCINGLVAQSHSVYAGTLLSCSMIERLKPAEKALLGRHISAGIGQVDHPFDSEARNHRILQPAPTD
ncbi:hypothetical protein BU25DRAFT_444169 [Macroventuria anomochaeta]|uniref:Uncharacterized protein n=1 Tax=Macroventuria anomochaeta TaxID=301207 RepID=A0ACB6SJ36_9PLEO|nr:uncharacterized protein BU25DRAFT_444169 [Macroventuria anomochaeta]KAF2633414.1 hypothetical protein BU25DRAFT_444169 [Macroventuria anomochaeta]